VSAPLHRSSISIMALEPTPLLIAPSKIIFPHRISTQDIIHIQGESLKVGKRRRWIFSWEVVLFATVYVLTQHAITGKPQSKWSCPRHRGCPYPI
jgi:hypothetical protein